MRDLFYLRRRRRASGKDRIILGIFVFVVSALLASGAWAAEEMTSESYLPSTDDIMAQKANFDDQRDLFETFHPKDILPPEIWNSISWDEAEMKKQTAEMFGYTAPELVGKIAPEIKPGKYTYKDVAQSPGLKELLPKYIVERHIGPGGPPFVCTIVDFEIEPAKQLHMALPTCELTRQNLGKSKLDKDGYLVARSWQGGIPFPRPSGEQKARQVYYNFEKKYTQYNECYRLTGDGLAFDKNLKMDKYNKYARNMIKFMGRAFFPPYGWYDERAESRGEFLADSVEIFEPRSNRGLITLNFRYDDPYKMDPTMMYLPQMRRIRKMSSTDTQDPNGDAAFDDMGFLRQKITPKRFPYKFEIIAEGEYLFPWSYNKGKAWIDKEAGYGIRDLGFMRRPCYVLQMTQLDPNYVYSKRIYYVDKEVWLPGYGEFYDQKGRLYRSYNITRSYMPECGQIVSHGTPSYQIDYIDTHSSYQILTVIPANHSRRNVNMENMIRRGK